MRHSTLEVGQIVNTHGLKGEVKVVAWTDYPEDFENLEYVYVQTKHSTKQLFIKSLKYQKSNLIVKFKDIDNIDEAEKLKGATLTVEREIFGEPEEGYYICDLIGCDVITDEGENLGKISDVFNTGSNDIYTVTKQGRKDILLPVIDDVVLSVDIDKEIVNVHLIEGLVD